MCLIYIWKEMKKMYVPPLHALIIIFLLVLLKDVGCQYTINVPERVEVQKGLCVHIPCNFTVPQDIILFPKAIGIWFRDTERVAAAGGKSRLALTGNVSAGDCSILIREAKVRDTGKYKFRLEGPTKNTYTNIQPDIMVTGSWKVSQKPYISPARRMVAGEEVTLSCTAPDWCAGTAPSFTWKGTISTNNTRNGALLHPYTATYMSNITFTPSRQDHNTSLVCTVTHGQVLANTNIILDVEYPPSMNITIPGYEGVLTQENKQVAVREGDSLDIRCAVTSNPTANITWSREDGIILNTAMDTGLSLALQNISLHDDTTYRCLAWNSHGSTDGSITISVESFPKQPQQDQSIIFTLFVVPPLLIVLLLISAFIIIIKKRRKQLLHNMKNPTKSMNTSDCEAHRTYEEIPQGTGSPANQTELEKPSKVEHLLEDEALIYINYGEDLQYASINFSNLKPNYSTEKEEVEYSVIQRNRE
uniref:Ig-like domain-containing protein n=1 Tax=Xenopus tropicalis TaxID=8364 RepID=A0A6I8R800_XENTR